MHARLVIPLFLLFDIETSGQVTISQLNNSLYNDLYESYQHSRRPDSTRKTNETLIKEWQSENSKIIIADSILRLLDSINIVNLPKFKPAVIFFTYDNCPPCKPILNILQNHPRVHSKEYSLVVVNHTNRNNTLARKIESYFGVEAFPTIILINKLSQQEQILFGGSDDMKENRIRIENELFVSPNTSNSM